MQKNVQEIKKRIRHFLSKENLKKLLVTVTNFLFNPRFLFCFGLAWIITNGWSYILLAVGTILDIGWMITVATAYLAFLWLPISPEKIVTIAIAMFLLRTFFPNDEKTLGILRELHAKAQIHKKKRQEEKEHAQKESDPSDPEKS